MSTNPALGADAVVRDILDDRLSGIESSFEAHALALYRTARIRDR
jgi:hypothetical protein